jgi:hypothetical protein
MQSPPMCNVRKCNVDIFPVLVFSTPVNHLLLVPSKAVFNSNPVLCVFRGCHFGGILSRIIVGLTVGLALRRVQ